MFTLLRLCGLLILSYYILIVHAQTPSVSFTPVSNPVPSSGFMINTSSLCNFTDRADLVDRISKSHLNVSEVVQNCEEVCILAFGTGNPDISGVGVMLSLIIMTGLTFIFGPILAVFDILVNKPGSSALFRSLKRIQVVITEADAFLVLSIQVAAIVRISQNPPIFEATFLKFLNFLLLFLILTTVFSQIAMNIEKTPRRATILCYAVTAYALLVVTVTTAGIPPGTFDIYQDVTEECHRSRGYENVSGYYKSSLKFFYNDKATKTIGIILAAFCVLFILVCGLPRFRKAVTGCMRKELSKSSKWGQLCAWQKPMAGAAFLFSICLGVGFYKLWITRALLAKLSGVLYQDNEWGFGQITASLLPAPIIVTAAHEVHGVVFGRAGRKETEEDRELLELHDRHYPG